MKTSIVRHFLTLAAFACLALSAFAFKVGDSFIVFSQRQTQGSVGYLYTWIKSPSGLTYYDNTYRPFATSDGYHETPITLTEAGTWTQYTSSADTGAFTKADSVDSSSTFTVDASSVDKPTIKLIATLSPLDTTVTLDATGDASVQFSAGTTIGIDFGYTWSDGSSGASPTIHFTSAKDYTVTVLANPGTGTDGTKYTVSDPVPALVHVKPYGTPPLAPTITASATLTTPTPTASISANPSSGSLSLSPTISWSTNSSNFSVTKNSSAWASSGSSQGDSLSAGSYTYTLTAQPGAYAATISWTATNATSFRVTGPGYDSGSTTSTSVSVSTPGSYTVTATGAGGSTPATVSAPSGPSAATASVVVTVSSSPAPVISGQTASLSGSATPTASIVARPDNGSAPLATQVGCSVSNTNSWAITKDGSNWLSGTDSGNAANDNLAQGSYTYTVTAQPVYSATISWSATNATSTTVSGPGSANVSGTTATVTAPGSYTITATGPGGSTTASVTAPAGGSPASASVTITVGPGKLRQGPVSSSGFTIKQGVAYTPSISGGSGSGAYVYRISNPSGTPVYGNETNWAPGSYSCPNNFGTGAFTLYVKRLGDANYIDSDVAGPYTINVVSYMVPTISGITYVSGLWTFSLTATPNTGQAPLSTMVSVTAGSVNSGSITKNGAAWQTLTPFGGNMISKNAPDTVGAGTTTYEATVIPSSPLLKWTTDWTNVYWYVVRGPNNFAQSFWPSNYADGDDQSIASVSITDPGTYSIEAWFLSPDWTSVSTTYTVPSMGVKQSVTVAATGIPQTVTISPTSATVLAKQTQVFTASGGADTGYIWSCSTGSLSGSGASVTWTAPATGGTGTITVRHPGGGNYAASNTATATVSAATAIQSLVPIVSNYTVSDPASSAKGRTYKRIWNDGTWKAYLGRAGLRFQATGNGSNAVQSFELQSQEPGTATWTTISTVTPASGAANGPGILVTGNFSVMLDTQTPGALLVPLSYTLKSPKVGAWNFRARLLDTSGAWSDWTPSLAVLVELPIAVVSETLQTLPPAGPEGAWFTPSKPKTFRLPVWIP